MSKFLHDDDTADDDRAMTIPPRLKTAELIMNNTPVLSVLVRWAFF